MKDILPFYTLDGSVGLYSLSDDDIYHSVYGAFSEAYDKFIEPAHIKNILNKKNEIKVLDICYGIGYNSKSFLNYFLENFSQKKNQKIKSLTESISSIYTDKIKFKNGSTYNDKIDTNNVLKNNNQKCNLSIHSDNTNDTEMQQNNFYNNDLSNVNAEFVSEYNTFDNENSEKEIISKDLFKEPKCSISIDAVDINDTLMKASPLFNHKKMFFYKHKTGIPRVDKYLSQKSPNKYKYKMREEVNFIILLNLIKQYGVEYFSEDLKKLLSNKKFRSFFNEDLVDFLPFYHNQGYKLSKDNIKSTFLHNIYYGYLSKSYKNTLKVLENNEISIRYISDDARKFINDNLCRYDLIFLDAFTASKCPALWTQEFFSQLYQRLSYDGILLTYSNSSAVRGAMLKSNFYIGKIFNSNENKFTGTVAVKNLDLIEHPLTKYEIGLLKTKAGIPYHDETLSASNADILSARQKEVKESPLISSSQYIKNFKELSNEI